MRWRHPQRGIVAPAAFIPVAEETGLIHALGRWVLNTACAQAAALGPRSSPGPAGAVPRWITVNLSGLELQHPGLVDQVAAALADSGLAPERLILEITETVLMHDTEATIDRLAALKELGVGLAVDDFGTGYSSLRYLSRFPIDLLKMAKPFVDGVDHGDAERRAGADDHRPRRLAGPGHRGRGHRAGRPAEPAALDGVRVRPGLPVRAAAHRPPGRRDARRG